MTDMDIGDIHKLTRDITALPGILTNEVTRSVQQTAMVGKKAYQKVAAKGPGGKQYSASIDYTVREFGAFGQGVIEAEVGPDLARYGGKTGKGGLIPSLGFLDDPESTGDITATPSRARRVAEKLIGEEFGKRMQIAIDESAKKAGL